MFKNVLQIKAVWKALFKINIDNGVVVVKVSSCTLGNCSV